ncbi:MAG: PHP domain-containing protein [Kiritimatiellaeota bacterium]|nr:PHP domain-containing protein [Kiritimatiellota bacterium]
MSVSYCKYPCDMHCHTVRSDGNDTPRELLSNAALVGLKVVAITDHDTPPPVNCELEDGSEVPCDEYASELKIVYVPGYEFSCDRWVDDVHICGYAMNWDYPALADEIQMARNSKSEAYKKLCGMLTSKGMEIDWELDILRVDTPNERAPDEVERKHIFEAIAVKGHTPTWSEAKIMVRDDPELNIRRRKIGAAAAIDLIHACGGVAVLAHPYLIDEKVFVDGKEKICRTEYIERLITAGLDGIEASYTYDKTSYKGTLSPEEIEQVIRGKYTDRLFISGGSDYHAGHKKGNAKVRHLGERGISMDEFAKFDL